MYVNDLTFVGYWYGDCEDAYMYAIPSDESCENSTNLYNLFAFKTDYGYVEGLDFAKSFQCISLNTDNSKLYNTLMQGIQTAIESAITYYEGEYDFAIRVKGGVLIGSLDDEEAHLIDLTEMKEKDIIPFERVDVDLED